MLMTPFLVAKTPVRFSDIVHFMGLTTDRFPDLVGIVIETRCTDGKAVVELSGNVESSRRILFQVERTRQRL